MHGCFVCSTTRTHKTQKNQTAFRMSEKVGALKPKNPPSTGMQSACFVAKVHQCLLVAGTFHGRGAVLVCSFQHDIV
jgi:hypothetical protein